MKNLFYIQNLVRMDLGDTSMYHAQKVLQYCVDGYRELKMKVDSEVSVLTATPNDANIIPLPDDYVRYTKIATKICGKLFTLSVNPNMPFSRKVECGVDVEEELCACACSGTATPDTLPNIGYGFSFVPHYRAGQYVGEQYGEGGGINGAGYFRVDLQRRQIQIQRLPRTELYIEYVSSGAEVGNIIVTMLAVKPIRAYVHWQMLEHRARVTAVEKQRKQDQYNFALAEYRINSLSITIDDILDATYIGRKSTPKF